jgi:hypothetical protein
MAGSEEGIEWEKVEMPAPTEIDSKFYPKDDPNTPLFGGLTPGSSRHCIRECAPKSVLETFLLFWSVDAVLQVFVTATNAYGISEGPSSRGSVFRKNPLTAAEFKAFLAIILFFVWYQLLWTNGEREM